MTDKKQQLKEKTTELMENIDVKKEYVYGIVGFGVAMIIGLVLLGLHNSEAGNTIQKLKKQCKPYLEYRKAAQDVKQSQEQYKQDKEKYQKQFSELQGKIKPIKK